jgi:hypothetical protein
MQLCHESPESQERREQSVGHTMGRGLAGSEAARLEGRNETQELESPSQGIL